MLEIIPVYAWLVILAAYGSGGADQVGVPLWALVLVALAYWGIGTASARLGRFVTTLLALLLGVSAALSVIGLGSNAQDAASPLDFTWLARLGADLAGNGPAVSSLLMVAAIFAYVGWRAASIGRRLPDVSGVRMRFALSFSALALACVTLAGLPQELRTLPIGWLSVLLPLDVFAGLLASSLARQQEARTMRAEMSQIDSPRWLGVALILSALVVLIALTLSAFINLDGVSALLNQLGPVGRALGAALNGVMQLLERVLSTLFDAPAEWLRHAIRSGGTSTTQQPTQPPAPGRGGQANDQGRWRLLAVIALSAISSLALILLAFGFMRLLRRGDEISGDETVEEERAALDGRALLREQARDLLSRFQRRPGVAPDTLPAGSVRALYRGMLQAAAAHGVGRISSETPDEYSIRLSGALREGSERADLETLTGAYDSARYGEGEPGRERVSLLKATTQRLTRRLSSQESR